LSKEFIVDVNLILLLFQLLLESLSMGVHQLDVSFEGLVDAFVLRQSFLEFIHDLGLHLNLHRVDTDLFHEHHLFLFIFDDLLVNLD